MKRLCRADTPFGFAQGKLARLRGSGIRLRDGMVTRYFVASAGFSRAGAPAPHGYC